MAAAVITPLAIYLGKRLGFVDRPDDFRKRHARPIPFTGGIAILLAAALPIAVAYAWPGASVASMLHNEQTPLLALGYGALLALCLGAADDRWNLRPRWKLLWQLAIALFACYAGFKIKAVTNPLGGTIQLGLWGWPLTVFWFLGCMNAINLLDGMDGLAAGVALFVCITMGVVNILQESFFPLLLSAALAGAILGFLIYNFNPARIFLGDNGTMVLGFLIAALSARGSAKASTAVALAIPFVALGLPIFDTTLAILRRWGRRMPVAAGDREHIHHVLVKLGLSQRTTVLILYGVCVALGAAALMLAAGRNMLAVTMLGILVIVALVCIKLFDLMSLKDLTARVRADYGQRQRGRWAAIEAEQAIARMEQADADDDLWQGLYRLFDLLELDYAEVRLQDDDRPHLSWSRGSRNVDTAAKQTLDLWSLSLKLEHDARLYGRLEVWKDARHLPLQQTTHLLERVRGPLAQRLAELRPGAASDQPEQTDQADPASAPAPQ